MGDAPAAAAAGIATRLNLPGATARTVRAFPDVLDRALRSTGPSDLDLDEDSLLAAAASAPLAARRRILAAAQSSGARLQIGGRDLVAAGVPAGPAIGRALSATRSARQSGEIRREDELAFALKAARS